eukprot:gb/GFBE01068661.1/.p1 GENE.gb/GFBE01068661.1/~~gb/GFBE01068661.1/.p1  ORF type:complete len:365 (+),score=83.52 gb/GFBE01068661.1/:1-1095(+)
MGAMRWKLSQLISGLLATAHGVRVQNGGSETDAKFLTLAQAPIPAEDALVFFACMRMSTLPSFESIPLMCTDDIPLKSAGVSGGPLDELRKLFDQANSTAGAEEQSEHMEQHDTTPAIARLASERLQRIEQGRPEVDEKGEESIAKMKQMFHREALIKPHTTKPHKWKPDSRYMLCYGPSSTVPTGEVSEEMNVKGCTGFFRHKETIIGMQEQLADIDRRFSNPQELLETEEDIKQELQKIMREIPSDQGHLAHTLQHVGVFYSFKIAIIILGHLTGLGILSVVGEVLMLPLPYVLYKVGADTKMNYKTKQKAKRMFQTLDGADAFFNPRLDEFQYYPPVHSLDSEISDGSHFDFRDWQRLKQS